MIKLKHILVFSILSFCLSDAQAMVPDFVKHMFANGEQSEVAKKIIEQLIIEKDAAVVHERRQARAIDIMVLTLIAWSIEEYVINHGDSRNDDWENTWKTTAPAKSAVLGGASWLIGELFEAISEKACKKISGKTLREVMGSSEILGIKIDRKRLTRRMVSLAALIAALYIMSQNYSI
ncbi:MAG: hypothetical protein WCW33_04500 [Candidatus Babeliales bacterium]